MLETIVNAVPLGTVELKSVIAGAEMVFPIELALTVGSSGQGIALRVAAAVNLGPLQSQFDATVKRFAMPDPSGYGTKTEAKVVSAALRASGDTAVIDAVVDVDVWQKEKGVPGGGLTVRWEQRCVDLGPLGRACTDVPVTVELPPGDDIKVKLVEESLTCSVALSLATPDGKSIEIRPGEASVKPRGDVGRFFDTLAGVFNYDLSAMAQRELAELVNDGALRQALPKEVLAYDPTIRAVQFVSRPDGALGAAIEFEALITAEQLAEWIRKSLPATAGQ